MLRRPVAILSLAALLGLTTAIARADDRPLIFAHRGASGEAPGNSLAAFRLAREQGADGVELDVRRTRDGHIVVVHDREVTLGSGRRAKVAKLTLAELRTVDLGGGERIPTLDQVFDVLGPTMRVNVEIKAESPFTRGLEKETVRIVRARGAADRVIFSSFNPISIRRVNRLAPEIPNGILVVPGVVGSLARRIARADAIHPDQRMVTATDMTRWREHGYQAVNTWTVNDPVRVSKLARLGVSGIITDFPARARRALGRVRPPPNRAARATRRAARVARRNMK